MAGGRRAVPISLRAALTPGEAAGDGWCDGARALSSYWTRSDDTDLQSQLVKYFKEPGPVRPHLTSVTSAYAAMLVEAARQWRPDGVVRVLASAETRPDPARPHSHLARLVSDALRAPEFTHIFFRTEPRNPMRMIDRLSGPEVLRRRIVYVLQDLFVIPADIGGTVLILDDIYNLGATARVYAAALKRFCGAARVYAASIAAARFSGGKDGWGRLELDVDRFVQLARERAGSGEEDAFEDAWVMRGQAEFHIKPDCPAAGGRTYRSLRFLARRDRAPCPACSAEDSRGSIRRWLGAFRSQDSGGRDAG